MLHQNSVVALFNQHTQAESGVKELQEAGFDMKSLSIVGKEYHTDENVVGYYTSGDRMALWGKYGAFWGGFWGLLFGSARSSLGSWRHSKVPLLWAGSARWALASTASEFRRIAS
jgi:hypothetical protein